MCLSLRLLLSNVFFFQQTVELDIHSLNPYIAHAARGDAILVWKAITTY